MWHYNKSGMKTFALVALLTEALCLGCVGVSNDSVDYELAGLRAMLLDDIRCQLGMLAHDRAFCCRVLDDWPIYSHSVTQRELVNCIEFPRFGVVKQNGWLEPNVNASYDVRLGDEIISALLKCTYEDAVSFGAISNKMDHTAGLVWFGGDGSSFAGMAVITPNDVYFIPTTMSEITKAEEGCIYDIYWAEPPYYMWRNPFWSLRLSKQTKLRECINMILSKKTISTSRADFCLENLITAFRIGVDPEKFNTGASFVSLPGFKQCELETLPTADQNFDTRVPKLETAATMLHVGVQLWHGGPYWAETNIGAELPSDIGYYFWWGDTLGYIHMDNCFVASDGSISQFSFDNMNTPTSVKDISGLRREGWITADDVLAVEHDAAHLHWKGNWRVPTKEDWDDLCSKCDWIGAIINGVKGNVIRGRGDYASASIFLPCGGLVYRTRLGNVGSEGAYWSSVPYYANGDFAYVMDFTHGHSGSTHHWRDRFVGQPIRPVQRLDK